MDLRNNKVHILLISGILALVATAFFLVLTVTPLLIVAYIFALLGIALFCFGKLYMIASPKSYPWFAAFPLTILRYLVMQTILSAVFIIPENLTGWSFSTQWFLLMHIILLAFFGVLLISMKVGKNVIEDRDQHVKSKVFVLRMIQTDVAALVRQFPEYEKPLNQVAEVLRYSDPMNHANLWVYDEKIRQSVAAMSKLVGEEKAQIPELCQTLLHQIADRNGMVKTMK